MVLGFTWELHKMEVIVDLSDIFWTFVRDVSSLPHDELILTEGYSRISNNLCRSVEHRFSLDAGVLHLTIDECERIHSDMAYHRGVMYDAFNHRFLFQDVTAVFEGGLEMVCEMDRAPLERCVNRMGAFIDVSDLASDMASSLCFR